MNYYMIKPYLKQGKQLRIDRCADCKKLKILFVAKYAVMCNVVSMALVINEKLAIMQMRLKACEKLDFKLRSGFLNWY